MPSAWGVSWRQAVTSTAKQAHRVSSNVSHSILAKHRLSLTPACVRGSRESCPGALKVSSRSSCCFKNPKEVSLFTKDVHSSYFWLWGLRGCGDVYQERCGFEVHCPSIVPNGKFLFTILLLFLPLLITHAILFILCCFNFSESQFLHLGNRGYLIYIIHSASSNSKNLVTLLINQQFSLLTNISRIALWKTNQEYVLILWLSINFSKHQFSHR